MNIKELATKDHLHAVERNLQFGLANLRQDMDFKFAAVDTKLDNLMLQMTVRLCSIVLAACTIMPFILKLFHVL